MFPTDTSYPDLKETLLIWPVIPLSWRWTYKLDGLLHWPVRVSNIFLKQKETKHGGFAAVQLPLLC